MHFATRHFSIFSQKTQIKMIKIGVLITTSMGRIDDLFNKSLKSALKQTIQPDTIIVVDDNDDIALSRIIKRKIEDLNISYLHYLPNTHTKHMSGCGAWNTGLEFLKKKNGKESYVAILDDDDEWNINYIKHCKSKLEKNPLAVFAFLKRTDCEDASSFSPNDLCIDKYLVGNPGVQGSNMFFRIDALESIGNFDESLPSCTDRDLMIRFIAHFGTDKISVIPKVLVKHNAHEGTVTSDFTKKRIGLDVFYKKHLWRYKCLELLNQSLVRAERLFSYPDSDKWIQNYKHENAILVTGVCGFIGSHVADILIQNGWKVIGIDDFSTGSVKNISHFLKNENFVFYEGDIADMSFVDSVLSHFTVKTALHFAALPRIPFSIDHPHESYAANVIAVQNFATIVKKHHIAQFVFASSSSVYGQGDGTPMAENDQLLPMSPYAEQKCKGEKILSEIFSNTNTHLLICRLFNVYGYSRQRINKYSTIVTKCFDAIHLHKELVVYGDGTQVRDFTHVSDVAKAFLSIVNNYLPTKPMEILNIGHGKPLSVNTLINIVDKVMGEDIHVVYREKSYAEPSYTFANNHKAADLLKWKPTIDISEGIELTKQQMEANEAFVVGVAVHNSKDVIRRCLTSILKQKGIKRKVEIVIADDSSSDDWILQVQDLMQNDNIHVVNYQFCNVVKTRNALNQYIVENFPNAVLIGRLDSDDEYAIETVLARIEEVFDKESPDIILGGNYLRQHGKVISRVNQAFDQLKDKNYLLSRLKDMANGNPESELPSCNLWLRPWTILPYPDVVSAEDHFLLVEYLLHTDKYKISIIEDLLMCIYNLNGNITAENKSGENYLKIRKQLYNKVVKNEY